MRKGRGPNIHFLLQGCCVFIYIVLFVYILFKFVKILYFDGLIFKYCFFILITFFNVVDRVWNDIVLTEWYGIEFIHLG